MIEAAQYLPTGAPPDWRVAEEGHPPTALRCCCPQPLVERGDDLTLCVLCGREPSVRLGSAPRPPQNGAKRSQGSIRRVFNPRSMVEQKHIGFVVPFEMAVALEEKAASADRSFSAECRVALRAHLADNERSATPAKGDASQSRGLDHPANEA